MSFDLRNSISLRLFVIGLLILLMMIPAGMVSSLVDERERTNQQTIDRISGEWSGSQTLMGPILAIPVYTYATTATTDEHGKRVNKVVKNLTYTYFLPKKLDIIGDLQHEVRYRSIYEAVVYRGDFSIAGVFDTGMLEQRGFEQKDILYDQATLNFSISDLRGIQNQIELTMDQQRYTFQPGTKAPGLANLSRFISAPVVLKEKREVDFTFGIKLNGSKSLYFMPFGKDTNVKLTSSWTTPSFDGDFLPDSRSINHEGFSASWSIVDLNRAYAQSFMGSEIKSLISAVDKRKQYDKYGTYRSHRDSSFGVKLLLPVDHYQKSDRSIKYAVLFIALTFLFFFFTEIFNRRKIHPFGYIIVGLSLVLFFVLLLSISEYLGFNRAYLIAAFATISATTLYARSMFKNNRFALILLGMLLFLFGLMFVLIQLEQYALLIGSVALFVILSGIMHISRDIWYHLGNPHK
jgi:inner membrane protein